MLQTFLRMFKARDLQLLVIEGSAGTGKTMAIKEVLKGSKCLFQTSHSTPLALYNELHLHRNEMVILEDLDSLLSSDRAVSMLKALCETTKVKTLNYLTTSQLLKAPTSFETASSVLISCNKLQSKDKNVEALLSRGLYITFEPSRKELLAKMEQILPLIDTVNLESSQRQKVLGFIKKNAPYASSLNLRHLCRGLSLFAFSLREEGFDWQKSLGELMGLDIKLKEVLGLMASKKPVKQQVKEFSGSRASYYRARRKVSASQGTKKMPKPTN